MISTKNIMGFVAASVLLSGCVNQDMLGKGDSSTADKANKVVINKGEKDVLFKYDNAGKLESKIYYESGKRDHIKKINTFYKNGNLKEEMYYSHGFLHGLSRVWYKDGQLKMMVHFRNDKPDGLEKWFYQNGNLKSEVAYKRGMLHGKIKLFYETGELKAEILFQNNEPVENEKIYYKTGELKYLTDFENGIIKESF